MQFQFPAQKRRISKQSVPGRKGDGGHHPVIKLKNLNKFTLTILQNGASKFSEMHVPEKRLITRANWIPEK